MTIKIRKAFPEDITIIQSIARNTIDMNYRVFLGDEKVDEFISGPCDAYIESGLGNMYVLTVSGTVRGFSVIRGSKVELLMMKHEDHRKGWGSILISAMEEKLFENHQEIILDSFENNHKTNQFYLKNGWKNTGTEFDEDAGENIYKFVKKK